MEVKTSDKMAPRAFIVTHAAMRDVIVIPELRPFYWGLFIWEIQYRNNLTNAQTVVFILESFYILSSCLHFLF